MVHAYFNAYLHYCKMVTDTSAVLNYRLPLLNAMASDPAAAFDPLNWLEVNRMVSEKVLAFSQANLAMAVAMGQLPFGKMPSAKTLLAIQQKALRPVSRTLSGNARRVGKKRKSR